MPIHCTNRDLDALRDQGGEAGPVNKLRMAEPPAVTVVDQVAILRFLKPVVAEIRTYEESLVKLLERCGTRRAGAGGQVLYDILPARQEEYDAEKKKLDEIECEITAIPLNHKYFADKVSLTVRDLEALEKFVVLPNVPE
jgi:hypothetical protein